MKVSALLVLCSLVCLGQQLSTETSPAHNVQMVKVQIEVDAAEPWSLSEGDTVEIRCSLFADSDQDTAKQLRLTLVKMEEGSIQMIETKPASEGISYTLNPVTLLDRGLYGCETTTTNPNITVENAYQLIWVNDTVPQGSLELLRVNRVKYFYDKTFTIGCQLPDDKSEWMIMSASEKTGSITLCPNQERSGNILSCTIPSLPFPVSKTRRYDPFWCEASTARKSNILNMTQAELTERSSRDVFVTKFDVTPAWFVREGDSVVLQCKVILDRQSNSDKCDLQLIWTKRSPGNDMTVLLSQRASNPINYILNNITHEHSGVYSCWDDGTQNIFAMPKHFFIWVQDDSPPVTIDVLSHNRTQFFHNEEVTFGCQLPSDQSQWKLMGFDKWTGIIKECETTELSSSRLLSCTKKMGYPWTDFLFWCESSTGLRSNVLNITNTVTFDVLEAPALPVMEGDDLTLRCLRKNKSTGEITADAAFFKFNSITFDLNDNGVITLKKVTKENEGLYSCRLKDTGETLKSYVTVKARPQEQHNSN